MKKIIALLLVGFTLVSCSGKNDTAKNVENGAKERIAELEKENKELKEKLSQYQKELISNESGQKIEKYLESFNNTIKDFGKAIYEKNEKRIRFKLDNPAATDINGALSNLKDGKVTDKDRENWKKYVLDPAVKVSKNVSSDITVIVKSPVDDKIILEVKGGEVVKNELK
ncbi:hypothetical protein [uncultured Parvimonas sp.]|uniref:hypothetical protein n=1 Tax=uncultured Parvimonas sp. TaxID=747372 RepID=UPI0028D0AD63|nr:hypothetical protein [uncultured Parvimonas sp.]